MPMTSYCKKCGQDVPVASVCPHCGSKLAANTVRLAWCVEHHPVRDWMCWNAVVRLVLPVLGMMVLLVILLELLMGGFAGLSVLLGGGFPVALTGGLMLLLAVLLLVFILQGDDLLDCVVDGRGVHVLQYLPHPTALKLLLRGKSPRLLSALEGDEALLIGQKDIAWKDIQRVQLWPEKTLVLFYAPRWWMRLALPCTPFTWEDTLDCIREKIGRKKAVILPPECRQAPAPKAAKARSPRKQQEQQLTMADIPVDDLPPAGEAFPAGEAAPAGEASPSEEAPVADLPSAADEADGDFTPLGDLLEELRRPEE